MPKRPSKFLTVNFITLCLYLFFTINIANVRCQSLEQETLMRLKQEWQNPDSLNHWTLTDQNNNTTHCSWPEVTCTNGFITGLNVSNKNIHGKIPPFMCNNLMNITVLDVHKNNFTGEFPVSLYNCSKLEHLDLSENKFAGKVPDDIDRAAELAYLNLCVNSFSGDIPVSVTRLQDLKFLQLQENKFNGSFPEEIGDLSNLEFLSLSYNGFVKSRLPERFMNLKKLRNFWMARANLVGGIPESIEKMAALKVLDLSMNNLTGAIPHNLLVLKNLKELYLYNNSLSGEIPRVVEAFNLSVVDLSMNKLTGTIPDEFGNLKKLSALVLLRNRLSGEIPESIGRLPALRDVRLFENDLSGNIPSYFGRFSPLESFQISLNRISGKLPEYLCNGRKLLGVAAFDNNLGGELPASLGNCSTLKFIHLSNNSFQGSIPDGLWTSPNLSWLIINDNRFTGQLPDEVSVTLERFEIRNNMFSGSIPTGVSSWRNLKVFSASNNQFTGMIPKELTALPHLNTLSIDRNQLTGALPSWGIMSWKSLSSLNLSGNQLSGQIPKEIGSLPVLTELDLSNNKFSGQIPPQISSLKLTSLNLSSNHLSGVIPKEFDNAAFAESFLNNPKLCATTSSTNINICNSMAWRSRKIISTQSLCQMLVALAGVILLAGFLIFFMIRAHQKRKDGLNSTWKLTPYQDLNFSASHIVSGLKEANLIGSGGSGKVYRVVPNQSGIVVGVKRIWNNPKLDKKLEKEFLAEVEILSTIRHLNIVKLLCCICNSHSKLLVYEYLENSSLDRWLHAKKKAKYLSGSVLDWPKRLQIAVGAAQGLCYMHHDCFPPIVHRDVKSSNILLDSQFNAKIADFGLAKMLIKQGELETASAVVGSFGYMAPEYANMRKVNEKTDVYSFGVVLLELTTGKEANFGDEDTCLSEWAWRYVQKGNSITEALDQEIKKPCYLEEMSSVFKLGLACTSMLPSFRPSMKEILWFLHRYCNHPLDYEAKKLGSEYNTFTILKTSNCKKLLDSEHNILLCNV